MTNSSPHHHRNTAIIFVILAIASLAAGAFAVYSLIFNVVNKAATKITSQDKLITTKDVGGCADGAEKKCSQLTIYTNGDYLLINQKTTKASQLDATDLSKLKELTVQPADTNEKLQNCKSEVDGIDTDYAIHTGRYSGSYSTCEYRRSRATDVIRFSHYNSALLEFLRKILYSN
ncbi:hypothetical protein IT414_01655 [bacterium]|nr:hypothetical protein [bacterium]